jgi:hypothetical protein
VSFAVPAKNSLTVLHKVKFLTKHNLTKQLDFTDPCFCGEGIQPENHVVNELNEHHLGHLFEWDGVEYASSLFFNQLNTTFDFWCVLFCRSGVGNNLGHKIFVSFKLVIHQYGAHMENCRMNRVP